MINVDIEAVDSAIYVDEVHFTNMIYNLMDNAIKYRKPDKPVNLTIHTWNDKDRLFCSIADDGIGIKKENLKKIFDKFYRVHTGNVHDGQRLGKRDEIHHLTACYHRINTNNITQWF